MDVAPESLTQGGNALTAFIAVRKKGIKIATDRLLWELLATMETGEFSGASMMPWTTAYGNTALGAVEEWSSFYRQSIDIRVKAV